MDVRYDEEGTALATDAKLATSVWLEYDGDDPELQGQYLLIDRDKDLGRGLAALGGKVEIEDFTGVDVPDGPEYEAMLEDVAANNARREGQEESGVVVESVELVGKALRIGRSDGSFEDPWANYHFVGTVTEVPDEYGHREGDLDWYDPAEMREQEYAFAHGRFVEDVLERRPFSAVIDEVPSDEGDQEYFDRIQELQDWPRELLGRDPDQDAPEIVPHWG